MSRRHRKADAEARDHRVWTWPIVLAVLTVAGLASALIGDGWWDGASWAALGVPVAVALWFSSRP
ncbi:MAG: hypothetical protein JWQ11_4765 [Rhizobacter sp.]|nr:hypothetical protein [Rhizobacter sp.]